MFHDVVQEAMLLCTVMSVKQRECRVMQRAAAVSRALTTCAEKKLPRRKCGGRQQTLQIDEKGFLLLGTL